MKKIFFALFAAAALLGAGCAKIDVAEGQLNVPEGEMAVRLMVSGPFSDAVRSYVSGTEADISTIMMLCFDKDGKYIVSRNATVTPATRTTGTLTGSVPSNTFRIHFLANFTPDVSSFAMGTQERSMMKSEALSSGIADNVRFWGYHAETSSTAMASWLSGGNTVQLLRDRAKVVLKMNLNEGADEISSLSWTIANGLKRGFVAAASTTGANPYTNGYTSSTVVTEYTSAGKYEWTSATENQTPSIWAAPDDEQFLFENRNVSDDPVKIIIKATYSDNQVKYHTILLQDDNKVLYPVLRNSTFTLTLKNLPKSMGAGSFEDALINTNYSNNPYAQVAPEVDEVNSEMFTLKVEDVVKIFYDEDYKADPTNHMVSIGFTYTGHDGGDISTLSKDNFVVSWVAKSEGDESGDVVAATTNGTLTAPTVEYSSSTGKGTISFPLAELEAVLHFNTLQVVASNSGLSRNINVYSIKEFNYGVDPKLVDNKTTRVSDGKTREVYKLTFTLPSDYPPSLYPIKVKLYSSTLVPFSDSGATEPAGSFNVGVTETENLPTSTQSSDWNYGANDWGQYYEYVIERTSASNAYTFYLNDILANLDRTYTSVGLYIQIDGFGDPIPLHAQIDVKETKTFQPANFNWDGFTGTATLGLATVTFTNSENGSSYISAGYQSGNYYNPTYHDGSVTISVPDGLLISGIEVTYYRSYYVGNDVSVSTGSYSKSGTTGTWTPGSTPASSVAFTMTRDSDNDYPRISAIKVSYQTKAD